MPFDAAKAKPSPASPHAVHVRIQIASHGKLDDGQLHGVPTDGPQALSFEFVRPNAAIAKQLVAEVIAKLRELARTT